MALVRNGQSLLASNNAVAADSACCCAPPATCGCVDWCCIEMTLTINGTTLPFLTFEEWQDQVDPNNPQPCQCIFCVSGGASGQLYVEYDDPAYSPSFVFANITFLCPAPGTQDGDGKALIQIQLTGPQTPVNVFYGLATAEVSFDCNGGEISIGEWTYASGPDFQGVISEWPTVTFPATFPCNPLP